MNSPLLLPGAKARVRGCWSGRGSGEELDPLLVLMGMPRPREAVQSARGHPASRGGPSQSRQEVSAHTADLRLPQAPGPRPRPSHELAPVVLAPNQGVPSRDGRGGGWAARAPAVSPLQGSASIRGVVFSWHIWGHCSLEAPCRLPGPLPGHLFTRQGAPSSAGFVCPESLTPCRRGLGWAACQGSVGKPLREEGWGFRTDDLRGTG